jgi:hypothetical protein
MATAAQPTTDATGGPVVVIMSGMKLDTVEDAVVTVIEGAKTGANAGAPPVDPQAPGLLRAYLIDTPDGRSGGVYLWRSEAAARRSLDTA